MQADAGFEFVAALRHLERHWADYQDPAFWTRLNPHLTVSDRPWATEAVCPALTPDVASRAAAQLDAEGFLATPAVVPEARMAPLRQAIETLAAHGIPSGFACVYDEYYQCFQGLAPLFAPILGEGYRWVAHGYWAFRVPPGDAGVSIITGGSAPHRDSMGPDARVLAGERPGILTLWLALTDVTPADSCIYVVPRHCDTAYATRDRDVTPAQFRLQDIRAVPVRAGSIVAWSTHLAHWGSRSSRDARGVRMSITMYFQRADLPPFDRSVFDEGGSVPLANRLRWILQSMGAEATWRRLCPEGAGG